MSQQSSSQSSTNRKSVQIGDMGKIVTGSTPSTKEEKNYGGKIPFVRVSDIDEGPFISHTDKTITETGLEEVKNRELPKDAIMVSCIGNGLGKTAIAREPCVTNQQINSIITNDEFDSWYVYYKLKENQEKLQKFAGGSAQPILSKTRFSDIELEVHSYADQKKIGQVLSQFDKKKRVNDEMNDNLEEMAKLLFRRWFIDFEGYDGEFVYDNDLEKEIPSTWEKQALANIADFLNGKAWQDFTSEGSNNLPVLKIKELRNGIREDSDTVAKSEVPEKYLIDDGDVIFSWSGSLVLRLWADGEAFLNQHLFKVTSENYPKWFFYFWIDYHIERFRAIAEAKKTTMGHIKRSDLKQAKVVIPDEDFLEIASEMIQPLIELMVENQTENRRLEKLRDTLLPKLMSGEIRASDISLGEEVESSGV